MASSRGAYKKPKLLPCHFGSAISWGKEEGGGERRDKFGESSVVQHPKLGLVGLIFQARQSAPGVDMIFRSIPPVNKAILRYASSHTLVGPCGRYTLIIYMYQTAAVGYRLEF
eukprot:jgi/Botrbrau1/20183/Bobra.0173s0081.1